MSRNGEAVVLALIATVVLCAGIIGDLSLRDWSSLLGALAFAGMVWRIVGTFPDLTPLARGVSIVLALNLLAGFIAQLLLSHGGHHTPGAPPPPLPPNHLGNGLVIAVRFAVLGLVLSWDRLLVKYRR